MNPKNISLLVTLKQKECGSKIRTSQVTQEAADHLRGSNYLLS